MRNVKIFLIGLAALCVSSIFFVKASRTDEATFLRSVDQVLRLEQLDAMLDQEALQARNGSLRSYDALTALSTRTEQMLEELRTGEASASSSPGDERLIEYSRSRAVWAEKLAALEKFKAANAIYRNSLNYLPMVSARLIERPVADEATRQMQVGLDSLIRSLLSYQQVEDPEFELAARNAMTRLKTLREKLPEAARDELDSLLPHAEIILTYKPRIDDSFSELSSSRFIDQYDKFFRALGARQEQAAYGSNIFGLCLFLSCIGLVAMILHTVFRLRHEQSALKEAVESLREQTEALDQQREQVTLLNRELEARVEDRTRALAQVNQALERASSAKSEFLANMSHEIRTPMTAVMGYADLMLDPDLGPGERLKYVQTIRRNSEHLLSLINDILDISKIEAGRMEVESIDCSPCQILVDVASLMRVRAVEKGLDFQVMYQTPVPVRVRSDPTRVRQILTNLVGNAIKFTQQGSVKILVRCLEPESASPRLAFEVADTGIGIPRGQLDRLFQAFMQADSSTTRKFGGTGLGLAISRRLAKLLGGDLTVESLERRGSSFTLEVGSGSLTGVAMLKDMEEAGVPVSMLTPNQLASLRLNARILLAEDGVDNQVLISTHLRKAGADVALADNGRRALDLALSAWADGRPFDVILMDMQMPELDGYGATSKLRSRGYPGPIIALTAHAMAGDREKCILAGCDDYMTKPINRAKLLTTIQMYAEAGAEAHRRSSPERAAQALASTTVLATSLVAISAPIQPPPPAPAGDELSNTTPLISNFADDDDMLEIIESFVHDLPTRSAALRSAADVRDFGTLRRLVHQLKGAAGGYGFGPITDAAAEVERSINDQYGSEQVQGQVQALITLCSRARATSGQLTLSARG